MNKLIYILILFTAINFNIYSQNNKTDFYGAYPSSYGINADSSLISSIGIQYPHSAYTEKLLKKKKRLSYTQKERIVLIKFYTGKELTSKEKFIPKKALKKKQKLDKLIYKYTLDTLKHSINTKTQISEYQKLLLQKAQKNPHSLSPTEEKVVKQIQKQQKKLEKASKRYSLNSYDSLLIRKSRLDTAHLTIKEKIRLIKIKSKKKHIEKRKLERLSQQGYPVPIRPKTSTLLIEKLNIFNSKNRPSKYIRKVKKLRKKYTLTPAQIQAYNKMKSRVPLNSVKEKYLAKRAYNKQEKFKQKKYKLDQQYFWSLQDKETIKRHKKNLKKTHRNYSKQTLFRNIQNLRQILKKLIS